MNRKESPANWNHTPPQDREKTPQKGSREPGQDVRKSSLKSFIEENRSLDTLALFTKIYARL